jgi:hypothetical protein
MGRVICPLCQRRKARRHCPALDQQICSICCGTKRLTEIACPPECPYLASAREHPPAEVIRKQESDMASVAKLMADLNDKQGRLFYALLTFLSGYASPGSLLSEAAGDRYLTGGLTSLLDEDVAQAAAALAATYETASRGLVYDHRPQSLPAERLLGELKPLLAEVGKGGGSAFERDAAVVLRRIESAARQPRPEAPDSRRAFLDLIARILRTAGREHEAEERAAAAPRIILP